MTYPTIPQFLAAADKFPPTDKARYAHAYTDLFKLLKLPEPFVMMELGVGKNAASLRMWKELFISVRLYGAEINKTYADAGEGVANKVFLGDLGQPAHRKHIANVLTKWHGSPPLDIIIDDGSHFAEHIHACFEQFFPLVRPGGMYVIEDLETNPRPQYHRGYRPRPLEWLGKWSHRLAADQAGPDRRARHSIHYYKNLVAIVKP